MYVLMWHTTTTVSWLLVVVEASGEGGGDTLEAAALEAGDGAGGLTGGCGGGEAVVPAEAPETAEIWSEAAEWVGSERLEVGGS